MKNLSVGLILDYKIIDYKIIIIFIIIFLKKFNNNFLL